MMRDFNRLSWLSDERFCSVDFRFFLRFAGYVFSPPRLFYYVFFFLCPSEMVVPDHLQALSSERFPLSRSASFQGPSCSLFPVFAVVHPRSFIIVFVRV